MAAGEHDRPGPDTWDALLAAELAEHGSWPNPGGWLDQPEVLVEAVQMIWIELARRRAARMRH